MKEVDRSIASTGPRHRAGEDTILQEVPTLPDDLTEIDQWVLWRFETRNGKATKVPYTAGLRRADSTRFEDCSEFEVACDVLRKHQTLAGLGFVFFASDPFIGIDLDDCLDGGDVKEWARGVVERFADTYCEISPSGNGLKIWARGKIPSNVPGVKCGDGSIEMYDRGRYFTVTGRRFADAPLEIEDHAADVLALHARLTGRDRGAGGVWPVQPLPGGKIPHGQQHSTLVSIAGTLRARRVCDAAILACLMAINKHQCENPGPPANIERIVSSTRRWDGRRRENGR